MGRLTILSRRIGWYVSSLMGDNHYARYVQHRRLTHPGEDVLSEREYWKMRHRRAELDPQGRCC